jgi:hypothetical protein
MRTHIGRTVYYGSSKVLVRLYQGTAGAKTLGLNRA